MPFNFFDSRQKSPHLHPLHIQGSNNGFFHHPTFLVNRGSPAIHPFANESFVHLPLTVALALARPESLPTSPEVIRFKNDEINGRLGEFRGCCWEDGGRL